MSEYWEQRKHYKYYQLVRQWLEEFSPAESLLDVGCATTPVATWGTFEKRYTIDKRHNPKLSGVESFIVDWLRCNLMGPISVITCLQVLEELPDNQVRKFVDKLFRKGIRVIISVPYKWSGTGQHVQDPIDLLKFLQMVGRDPTRFQICSESGNLGPRIVALFEGEA